MHRIRSFAFRRQYNLLSRDYWFGQVDSRPLSVFRIVFAALLLKNALYYIPVAKWFYSDAGIVPRWALMDGLQGTNHFSVMDSMPSTAMAVGFFILWSVVLLALLVGYRTRLMSILNLLILLSVDERNLYVLNGADTVFRVLSFWSIFLPLGHHYSVDGLLARWRRYGRSRHLGDLRAPASPRTAYTFPVRLIQLQVALVYAFTSYLKMPPEPAAWQKGEALYYALQLKTLTLPTGDWLLAWGPDWLLRFLDYYTLFTEASFTVLVFSPVFQPALRIAGLTLATLLHVGIGATMSIPNFSMLMIASYLVFFEGRWIEWLGRQLRLLPRHRHPSTARVPAEGSPLWLLLALTPEDAVGIAGRTEAGEGPDQWTIRDEDGAELRGQPAWLHAIGHLPASRLWGWLVRPPFMRRLIWRGLSLLVSAGGPLRPDPEASPLQSQRTAGLSKRLRLAGKLMLTPVLAVLMGLTIWWNLSEVVRHDDPLVAPMPGAPRAIMEYSGLAQYWGMFSPYPRTIDGWVVIPGVFENGESYNLLTGQPVSDEVTRRFWGPGLRWKKFEENIRLDWPDPLLNAWASYYCTFYNIEQGRPAGERLATLEIHIFYSNSHPPGEEMGETGEHGDDLLWKHWCYQEYAY